MAERQVPFALRTAEYRLDVMRRVGEAAQDAAARLAETIRNLQAEQRHEAD